MGDSQLLSSIVKRHFESPFIVAKAAAVLQGSDAETQRQAPNPQVNFNLSAGPIFCSFTSRDNKS